MPQLIIVLIASRENELLLTDFPYYVYSLFIQLMYHVVNHFD